MQLLLDTITTASLSGQIMWQAARDIWLGMQPCWQAGQFSNRLLVEQPTCPRPGLQCAGKVDPAPSFGLDSLHPALLQDQLTAALW